MKVIFLVECPTPQRAPVLDQLELDLTGAMDVYYLRQESSRGWGEIGLAHRYTTLDSVGAWLRLAKSLLSPGLTTVCLIGYRGVARVAAACVARIRGVPLVVRGDSNVRMELARPAVRRALKRWYLRALLGRPEIWAIGSANTAYWNLLGFPSGRLIPFVVPRLPGGAQSEAELRDRLKPGDRVVFTYVGRLESIKGIEDLLCAYDSVRDVLPENSTMLVIAGKGSLDSVVESYSRAHHDCVWLGPVPYERLGPVYAIAHVVVVPSHQEPWGLVVNEALGFGARVIASDAVGAADDLCGEKNGTRFPAGRPRLLAEAMLAEYRRGTDRVPPLASESPADAMAQRLRALAHEDSPVSGPHTESLSIRRRC